MGTVVLPITRKKMYRGVFFSLGSVVLISCFAMLFQKQAGYSFLLGGVLWFIPELFRVYRLFHRMEMHPQQAVMKFYLAEVVKLLMVALLFVLMVKLFSVSFLWFIAGYFVAQITFFIKGIH